MNKKAETWSPSKFREEENLHRQLKAVKIKLGKLLKGEGPIINWLVGFPARF